MRNVCARTYPPVHQPQLSIVELSQTKNKKWNEVDIKFEATGELILNIAPPEEVPRKSREIKPMESVTIKNT